MVKYCPSPQFSPFAALSRGGAPSRVRNPAASVSSSLLTHGAGFDSPGCGENTSRGGAILAPAPWPPITQTQQRGEVHLARCGKARAGGGLTTAHGFDIM